MPGEKRRERPRKPSPRTDSDPFVPVYDKPPKERTGKEVREAIEADAWLERKGETGR